MSVGDVAGLIAAIAFVVPVDLLAVALLAPRGVLDEGRTTTRGLSDSTVPLIGETTTTAQISTSASAPTANLGSPVVEVAALTSGVRRAVTGRRAGVAAARGGSRGGR